MQIQSNRNNNKLKSDIKYSAEVAAIATGIYGFLLPNEQKNALQYRILGEDSFLKDIKKFDNCENIKDIKNPKLKYEIIKKQGNAALKSLLKCFSIMTIGFCAGTIISDKMFTVNNKKS